MSRPTHMTIPDLYRAVHSPLRKAVSWREALFAPKPALTMAYIRILLFSFFVYKLLSRDFRIFGLAPESILHWYPSGTFVPMLDYNFMGWPLITDLTTGHFVHWVLPLPNESAMSCIYWSSIALCAAVVFLGRGPRNLLAISAFALLNYQWGFLWRSLHDVDSVFIHLMIAFFYCFTRGQEALVIRARVSPMTYTRESGWFYSMAVFAFVFYYFTSGINKVVDIGFVDWFRYPFTQIVVYVHDLRQAGVWWYVPELHYRYLSNMRWLDYVAVPMVYFSHLSIPMMFFWRKSIPYYMLFYFLFHAMAVGVVICFSGNIFVWLLLVPVHRLFQPVVAVWDGRGASARAWVTRLGRLNWLGLVHFVSADEVAQAKPEWVDGWPERMRHDQTWVRGVGSSDEHYGYDGWRRLAWALPVVWPVLPLLYLPPVPFIGRRVADWMARKRTRENVGTAASDPAATRLSGRTAIDVAHGHVVPPSKRRASEAQTSDE